MKLANNLNELKEVILEIERSGYYTKNFSNDKFLEINLILEALLKNIDENIHDNESSINIIDIFNKSTNPNEMYDVIFSICDTFGFPYTFNETVLMVFNPIIKYIQKNEFEISVKKINTYNPLSVLEDTTNYMLQIDQLEDSLYNRNYGDVCSKSFTILQSLFKEILNYYQIKYDNNANLLILYGEVKKVLRMEQQNYKDNEKDDDLLKFTGKINECVQKISEIRNIYSSSHGIIGEKMNKFNNLPHHHYKMIVDTTKTITNFLLGTLDYQENK